MLFFISSPTLRTSPNYNSFVNGRQVLRTSLSTNAHLRKRFAYAMSAHANYSARFHFVSSRCRLHAYRIKKGHFVLQAVLLNTNAHLRKRYAFPRCSFDSHARNKKRATTSKLVLLIFISVAFVLSRSSLPTSQPGQLRYKHREYPGYHHS